MRSPRLKPESPVPLYHQIAEFVRYAIATGQLRPGERVPAVRTAAVEWGVNLHTVRRAYADLAAEGLLAMDGTKGARVADSAPGPMRAGQGSATEAFLDRILDEAYRKLGLSPADLGRAILDRAASDGVPPRVHFIECSRTQANGHARELAARWKVDARGWSLSSQGALPEGDLVATYFHYNDLRLRDPKRVQEIHFAAIQPDPEIARVVPAPPRGKRGKLLVCELDEAKALSIAADLSLVFPNERWDLETVVAKPAGVLRAAKHPVLLAPRVWDLLHARQRRHPLAVEIRYVLSDTEQTRIATSLGWQPVP